MRQPIELGRGITAAQAMVQLDGLATVPAARGIAVSEAPPAPGRTAALTRRPRIELLGVRIDDLTMDETLTELERLIGRPDPAYAVTPNVDHLVKLQHDAEFRRVYEEADLVLADGMPLLWASRLIGRPLREKVSGSDLFFRLAERAADRSYRLFFLGGRPGAGEEAARRLRARFPGLEVCGTCAPPMGFDRDPQANRDVVRRVRAANPDVLLVGLGAPRQEKWIHAHREQLGVPVSIGVGVSIEFAAGLVRRAPVWMQRAGFEWTWRLLMEPRKLWRRYLVDDMSFFYHLARHHLLRRS